MLSPTARAVVDGLRLSGGVLLVAGGLLAHLPPLNDQVWLLSVPLLEAGYWSIGLLPILCIPVWRHRGLALTGAALGVGGVLLLCTPVAQAVSMGRQLSLQLETAFGGSGGDPALASAAAVARRYALRAARAELEAAKATAAVTELRRDLAEALAREAGLRAAHAGAS